MKYVLQKFKHLYKRSISLFEYIRSFPILLISILSIFINLILYIFYLSTGNFILISILVFIVLIVEVPRIVRKRAEGTNVNVQIFSLLTILYILTILSIYQDLRDTQKVSAFTTPAEAVELKILDISKSKGDIQEVVFQYGDLRGVGYIDWFENLSIGDTCIAYGEIKEPENFSDFNYKEYLRKKNIYLYARSLDLSSCRYEFDIYDLSSYAIHLKRTLRDLRDTLSNTIDENLPEPQSSLLIGILFGSARAFSNEFEEALRVSGTTHIIAASGYNVTILIMLCNKLFSFLNKKVRLILSLILIWLFCIFSGLSASILRATVVGSLTILSLLTGNVKNSNLIIPAGIYFLLLINPKILFDIGFQLSILATLGLLYLMPSIKGFLDRIFKVPKVLEDYLLSTLSATLATLPVSISVFGKVSLVSIFANMIVLALTESTMLYGVISMFSKWFFSIVYFQLKIFEYVVLFFGEITWGYVDIESSWIGIIILVFIILFCIYFYPVDNENYYIKKYYNI